MRAGDHFLFGLERVPMVPVFEPMSWRHIRAVMDYDLPVPEKCLLVVIGYFANHKTDQCYPAVETLAASAGFADARSVRRVLARLVEKGHVKINRRRDEVKGDLSNTYEILYPEATSEIIKAVAGTDSKSSPPADPVVAESPPGADSGPPKPKESLQVPKRVASKGKLKGKTSRYSKEAEQVWVIYPRKENKPAAMKKIEPAIKEHGLELILKQVTAWAESWDERAKAEGDGCRKFIQHPTTWFNNERYLEDSKDWFPIKNKKRKVDHSAGF